MGVHEVCMTGVSDLFFWVENLHMVLFWVRGFVRYFLGVKNMHIFLGLFSLTFRFRFSL